MTKMAKCPKCKKDYEAGIEAAYKLGILDGENRLHRTINHIKATHREMLKELLRLDREQPLTDNCIKLGRLEVEKIIRYILRKNKNSRLAKNLQKKIDEQINISPEVIQQFLEEGK